MFTTHDYKLWYNKEKKKMLESGIFKSEPTFLFKPTTYDPEEWVFNPDNWNGGDILRHFLYNNVYETEEIERFEIKYYVIDDQTTVLILSPTEWYEISWYKSRGRTDTIYKNGSFIFLDEYVELCNLLGVTLQ